MTRFEAELQIEADIDGDGSKELGKFIMDGNVTINEMVNPKPVTDETGGDVLNFLDEFGEQGEPKRRAVTVDLGAGTHTFEIDFQGWTGSDLQWGNTGDSSQVTAGDATGADPMTQMHVLMRYITVANPDSLDPARLIFGEYSTTGLYEDTLSVTIDVNEGVKTAENRDTFNGNIICRRVYNLREGVGVGQIRKFF